MLLLRQRSESGFSLTRPGGEHESESPANAFRSMRLRFDVTPTPVQSKTTKVRILHFRRLFHNCPSPWTPQKPGSGFLRSQKAFLEFSGNGKPFARDTDEFQERSR